MKISVNSQIFCGAILGIVFGIILWAHAPASRQLTPLIWL